MKTILIVGSDYYSLNERIKKTYETLGYNCAIVVTNLGIKREDYWVRIKNKLGINIDAYKKQRLAEETDKVLEAAEKYKPDILYVRAGVQITKAAITELSKKMTTVLILGDAISRYPNTPEFADAYDYIFTFEPKDVPVLKACTDKPVNIFIGSYSDVNFYKIPDTEKSVDVAFVGSMYPFRRELLERLAADCKDLKMEFYGPYTKWYEVWKKAALKAKKGSPFKDCAISAKDANELYNRSKICLNLQHPQSEQGWNARLSEILGSGSFEIVTRNEAIADNFEGALETYGSYDELLRKIRYYTTHDEEREKIAAVGHKTAISELSCENEYRRMTTIFDCDDSSKGKS